MISQEKLKPYRIVLASQSPRRRMLLEGLNLNFEVFVRENIDEIVPEGLNKFEIPIYLAEHKSNHYEDLLNENTILITADTIVWHNNRELGKPQDYKHAIAMLSELSGDYHEVITGVCIRSKQKRITFHTISKVKFRNLSLEEIEFYISNYKPFDKAGSYGIQEWIGYAGIEGIEGSFYNVMGLPVQTLYLELINFIKDEKP